MPRTDARPPVLLFDVNETLLDLAPLKERIGDLLQDAHAGPLWFATLLQHSLVLSAAGQFRPFPEVGAAVLQMMARNADLVVSPEDARECLSVMTQLPPHPDVAPGLQRLKDKGLRMAALTNSSKEGVKAQMAHAALTGFFEQQISVEAVGKYKPHPEVYAYAAQQMGVSPQDCMLVAAHGWDVAGAAWAGLRTAFIAREGQQKFPLAEAPEIDVADLAGLAAHFCD